MNLTDVIAIWDELHVKDVGELGYCDLQTAIEKVVGIHNNVDSSQPDTYPEQPMTGNHATPTGTVHGTRLGKWTPRPGTQHVVYDCGIGWLIQDRLTKGDVTCKRCLVARARAGKGKKK